MRELRKFLRASGIFAAACLFTIGRGFAQEFPSFPSPIYQPQYTFEQGTSAFSVPNAYYGNVVMAVFGAEGGRFGFAESLDGQNYFYGNIESPANVPNVDCNSSTPSTCAAAVTVFNGIIYVAYADSSTHGLDVAIATPIPGNTSYQWALTHTDNSVQLVTTPAMSVSPDGSHLIIIYGTSNDRNTKNQFFESTLDLTGRWTQASEGGNLQQLRLSSASRPAVSVLNGQLWLCSQQNNSNHQLFVYNSADGINWNFVEQFSALALGGGAQMVTFKGNLVLANQQNNSNHALFIFSSPNGVNWYAQEYANYRMGGDPGLALHNGGISLVFKANNSGNALYGSFATQ